MKTLFYHGLTRDGRRFTVAGKFNFTTLGAEIDSLSLGISICSSNDTFFKKVGRIRSEGRMNGNPVVTRGVISHSLYSKDFYKGIPRDKEWWVGKELGAFLDVAKSFEGEDARDLQEKFRLHHTDE